VDSVVLVSTEDELDFDAAATVAAVLTDAIVATTLPSASENEAPTFESLQQFPDSRFLSQQYCPFWHCSMASLPDAVPSYVQIFGQLGPQLLSVPGHCQWSDWHQKSRMAYVHVERWR
jgi:hypothetical protein